METGLIVYLAIFIVVAVGIASRILWVKHVKANAQEWFNLSMGARRLLGVKDSTTETGFIFNMKESIAHSNVLSSGKSMVGTDSLFGYCSVIDDLIDSDLNYIYKHKGAVPADELYKDIGFTPKQIEFMMHRRPEYREVTDAEWDMIYEQYQIRLDEKLAEFNMIELSAQRISDGYHKSQQKVAHTEKARKELSAGPENKWDNDYDSLLQENLVAS